VPPSLVYKIINTAGAARDQPLQLYFFRLEGHRSFREIENNKISVKFPQISILKKRITVFKLRSEGDLH
jgi:hypothetical protein